MTARDRILAENLADIRGRIADAAAQCGRQTSEIRLVGVTKYVDAAAARSLAAAGCGDLGESRPQELWSKGPLLAELEVRWHLVGHLQRNKVRRTLPWVHLIHSLDSESLAVSLETEAAALDRRVAALVEVNISGDPTKHGVAPEKAPELLQKLAALKWVEVRGLMTMSHREGDSDVARGDFARLRELRDSLRGGLLPEMSLDELSMGMSDDFEAAVLEGATLVRIGSALFRGIDG